MTRPFRALLLDVDDTLIDTQAAMLTAGTAAVAALWPERGDQLHHDGAAYFYGDPYGYFDRFTRGELTFADMRLMRIAAMVEELGLDPVDELGPRFESAYAPAYEEAVRLFDDVAPLLQDAAAAGLAVGALTNSDALATKLKLGLTGLSDAFVTVATTDDLGFGKPDPRAFEHACHLMGFRPAETVYVGDHLEVDAVAATEAGLYGVWLRRENAGRLRRERKRREYDALAQALGIPVISSLAELASWLTKAGDDR